jgi:hypothetical protein
MGINEIENRCGARSCTGNHIEESRGVSGVLKSSCVSDNHMLEKWAIQGLGIVRYQCYWLSLERAKSLIIKTIRGC